MLVHHRLVAMMDIPSCARDNSIFACETASWSSTVGSVGVTLSKVSILLLQSHRSLLLAMVPDVLADHGI